MPVITQHTEMAQYTLPIMNLAENKQAGALPFIYQEVLRVIGYKRVARP